jgi:hypothetical protein
MAGANNNQQKAAAGAAKIADVAAVGAEVAPAAWLQQRRRLKCSSDGGGCRSDNGGSR